MNDLKNLPLEGIRVVEFTHMVMGPAVGCILGDLGADVVKIEPISGDNTRKLKGSGAGYFPMFNRSKRSICLNLKDKDGKNTALELKTDFAKFSLLNGIKSSMLPPPLAIIITSGLS